MTTTPSAASQLPRWLLAGLTAALRAAPEAIADARGNIAPPAPDTSVDLASGLAALLDFAHANLPAVITTLRTHPGEITAAAHVLDAMAGAGVPYAAEIRQWVLETPGALDAAEAWVDRLKGLLATFAPAPNPLGGMGADRVLHGRG